jgi:hypothetical protein
MMNGFAPPQSFRGRFARTSGRPGRFSAIGDDPAPQYDRRRRAGTSDYSAVDWLPPKVRAWLWVGAGVLLLALAIAIAALAIAIHNLSVNSKHARHLGLRSEMPLVGPGSGGGAGDAEPVWTSPQSERARRPGESPRWDPQGERWVLDYGTLEELRDVQLGSKERPLADGDLLRWERGRVVNARDPMLTQKLGHHVDAKIADPRTGDILLYNDTAGQWQNVPLRVFMTMGGLRDVRLPSMTHEDLQDGASLRYDAKRGHWSYRPPHARAWMSFCVSVDSATGAPDAERWGHLSKPLMEGVWVPISPKSNKLSVFAVDQYTNGGMRVSRKYTTVVTPRHVAGHGTRPSAGATTYSISATVSTVGFPPGAWGILVGTESAPQGGDGFVVAGSEGGVQTFSLETVRNIGCDTSIALAYRVAESGLARRTDADGEEAVDAPQPLVQCLRLNVEEL